MAKQDTVIVFGPTGAVGCAAAIEANGRGAKVWLAMRDPKKSIPGLDDSEADYTRVQADLSDPSSLTAAVKESGANLAFAYVLYESPDAMRGAFDALKEAGIKYLVLLSSYTIQGAADDETNQKEYIQRVHAVAEVALKASGLSFTSVRPAYFNSNLFWFYGPGISKGEVDVLYPEIKLDYIAPSDIGKVCGTLLTSPPESASSDVVYLTGPELLTQREAMQIVGEALGKNIKVNAMDEQGWFEKMSHIPRQVLETVAEELGKSHEGMDQYPKATWEAGTKGIERITGRKATKLGEWVKENKGAAV